MTVHFGDNTTLTTAVTGADTQIFTSSGTWTKPSTGTYVIVHMWGAGGAGGNSATYSGGGGGGAYMCYTFKMSDLPGTVSVTVGAGGTNQGNGGHSAFGYADAQVGGGQGATASTNQYHNTGHHGGDGATVYGSANAGNGGGMYTTSTDDGTTEQHMLAPVLREFGIGGGGGSGLFGICNGGGAILGGGGGGAYRGGSVSSGGVSHGGGNGGAGNGSAGGVPGGGGGALAGAGGRGEVRIIVV